MNKCRFTNSWSPQVCQTHTERDHDAALCDVGKAEMEAQLVELMQEVKEWLCEKCRTVYPSQPNAVPGHITYPQCPKCGNLCGPYRAVMERELKNQLREVEESLEAHLVGLRKNSVQLTQLANFIKTNFKGEPSRSEDVGDTAVRLLTHLRDVEAQLISGFYEEKYPIYSQGNLTHELQELMTAEEATDLVSRIKTLQSNLRERDIECAAAKEKIETLNVLHAEALAQCAALIEQIRMDCHGTHPELRIHTGRICREFGENSQNLRDAGRALLAELDTYRKATVSTPNLQAVLQGCVSADAGQWPQVRVEVRAILAERDSLRQAMNTYRELAAEKQTRLEKMEAVVEAAMLKRNVLINDPYRFEGAWIAVPKEDFDKLRSVQAVLDPVKEEG